MGIDSLSAGSLNPANTALINNLARQAPGVVGGGPLPAAVNNTFITGAAGGALGYQVGDQIFNPVNPGTVTPNPPASIMNHGSLAPPPPFYGGQNPAVQYWLLDGTVTTEVQAFGQDSWSTVSRDFTDLGVIVPGPIQGFEPWSMGIVGGLQTVRPTIFGAGGATALIMGSVYLGTNFGNNRNVTWTGTFRPDTAYPPNTPNPSLPGGNYVPAMSPNARNYTPPERTIGGGLDLGINPPDINGDRRVGAPVPGLDTGVNTGAGANVGAGAGANVGAGAGANVGAGAGANVGAGARSPSISRGSSFESGIVSPGASLFPPLPFLDVPVPEIGTDRRVGAPVSDLPSNSIVPTNGLDTARRDLTVPQRDPQPAPAPEPTRILPLPLPDQQGTDCLFTNTHQTRLNNVRLNTVFDLTDSVELHKCKKFHPEQDDDVTETLNSEGKGIKGIHEQNKDFGKILEEINKSLCKIETNLAIPDSWNVRAPKDRPQLVVVYKPSKREIQRDSNLSGSRWSLSIPHVNPRPNMQLPSYKKGNTIGILELNDNSKIYVNAFDDKTAQRVIRECLKLVNPKMIPPNPEKAIKISPRRGDTVKVIEVEAVVAHFYENGRSRGTKEGVIAPTKTYDLQKKGKRS